MPRDVSPRPLPYESPSHAGIHRGRVTIPAAGLLTVDLGLRHPNFSVSANFVFKTGDEAFAQRMDIEIPTDALNKGKFKIGRAHV